MNQQNKRKVALITGSARRIGKSIALKLHEQGFDLVIHCLNSVAEADLLVKQLNELRTNSAIRIKTDLHELVDCEALVKSTLDWHGRLDVLINNASTFFPLAFNNTTPEDFDKLFDVNVKAPYFLAQAATDALTKVNGCIINLADIHGVRPLKGYSAYSMTKAALISMTYALAKELAPSIRVNAISPGAVSWPEFDQHDTQKQQAVINKIPLGRIGSADDIAETAAYIISCEYLTGQVIAIDGGRSLNQ
jgi:pteridine reductase